MKKALKTAVVMMMTAAMLTACSGGGGTTTAPAQGGSGTAGAGTDTDWPKEAVTVVVPYSAGGDTDTYCRTMCAQLSKDLGANFVVVNTTGGSGVVASTSVLDANADGNTVLFHHTGVMLTQEAVNTNQFSFLNDFEVCATVARDDTYVLVAKSDSEYMTLEDFVSYCKDHPGEVKYSITFNGATHAVATLMEQTMGIELNKIDVGSSAADRLTAFMAGQCDCLVINYMNVADYIENGDFVVLGVCAEERPAGMEDFPTMKEQGYDVVQSKLYEVRFPKGTDQAIVDKMSSAIEQVTSGEEFKSTLATYYAQPYYRDAATTVSEDTAEVEELKTLFEE